MQSSQSKDNKKRSSGSSSTKDHTPGDEKSLIKIIKDQASEISSLKSKMKNFEKRLCELETIIDELEIDDSEYSEEEEKA